MRYSSTSSASSSGGGSSWEPLIVRVERIASGSAVVVFSMSSCCMCHALKHLFSGMGVSPTVYDLDLDPSTADMDIQTALLNRLGIGSSLPVVFVGGKLVGPIYGQCYGFPYQWHFGSTS